MPRTQEGGTEQNLPQSPQKASTLPTPWFQTPDLQNCERIHFCCFKLPSFDTFFTLALTQPLTWST